VKNPHVLQYVKENTERELSIISRQCCQVVRNIFRRFLDYPEARSQHFEIPIESKNQLSLNVWESGSLKDAGIFCNTFMTAMGLRDMMQ
jgi:hypothetical protein